MEGHPINGTRGGQVPGTVLPAFTLHVPADLPVPILIAAPHGGRSYPGALIERMRDPAFAALRLEDRHVDRLAAAVAQATGAALIVAHAPRAMLDLNRATDDMDWSMVIEGAPKTAARHSLANRRARSGLGLIPRRLPGLGEIWKVRLSRAELDARIAGIHVPYHAALGSALETLRDRWGAALLVDLHSMPPLKAQLSDGPACHFVIGDRFGASCDRGLAGLAIAWLAANGQAAAHNRPYAGGYVLARHGAPARGIDAIQIEVCRSRYLDARFDEPSGRFAGVAKLLAGFVRFLAGEVAAMGEARQRPASLPLAAE